MQRVGEGGGGGGGGGGEEEDERRTAASSSETARSGEIRAECYQIGGVLVASRLRASVVRRSPSSSSVSAIGSPFPPAYTISVLRGFLVSFACKRSSCLRRNQEHRIFS